MEAPPGSIAACIHSALRVPINQLQYNRRECQQLVDHVEEFITSLKEKSYTQDLLDLQQRLSEALTDLYVVLTDICQQPQLLKQILWRDGISTLVLRAYEILNATPFNARAQKDLIHARSLDDCDFHDVVKKVQGEQIFKILGVPRNQLPQAIIALHQRIRTILDESDPERQFLETGLRAMQDLTACSIPPLDAFSMSEFDVVINRNKKLGKGGFGEVFEGNWHGTKVAIKRITNFHPALGENEINVMKQLKHDHILQMFGANLDPYQSFLVSSFKSQGDVSKFLLKNPSANRRKLSYEVSLGLAYLHEKSVIHGDLKPPNILIDEHGVPCLCDFGLSRIRTHLSAPPSSPLDDEQIPAGTFWYMSPEQMEYGVINEYSDVYSFGMTIYEIFSGDPPFKNISCWSLLRSNVVDLAKRPAKPHRQADHERGLDNNLWGLIVDCWSQEPSNRPTAATVSSRLDDLNGRGLEPKFSQSHKTLEGIQDQDVSIDQDHSTGNASTMSSHCQRDLVPPRVESEQNDKENGLASTKRYRNDDDIAKISGARTCATTIKPQSSAARALPSFTSSQSTAVDRAIQDDPKMMSTKNHPVMILLLGEIGAGKSTFINTAAGKTLTYVGHDLEACTRTVQHFIVRHHDRNVVFVDTPGFNHPDPLKTDGVILKEIVDWLKYKCPKDMDIQFGGIIYLYDLGQLRYDSRGKILITPMKLSSSIPKVAPHIILATVDGNGLRAKHREKQLMRTIWQEAQIQQFTNTKISAWSIIDTILDKDPIELPTIQEELERLCTLLLPPKRRFIFS